jgi:hypothetical protein
MPLGYRPVSSSQRTVRPVLVVVARDQLDNHPIADEGLGTPVLADEGEETVLASRVGESHPHALLEPLDSYGSRCSAVDMQKAPMGEEIWVRADYPRQPIPRSLWSRA